MEMVDTLLPPLFTKSGTVKSRAQAYEDRDWLGCFNLWIVQSQPVPAIVYQIRSLTASWEPGKLDVSVGGHYIAGETLWDGLREAKEEVGKDYLPKNIMHLGKRLNVSLDQRGQVRQDVLDITIVTDNQPLATFTLQEKELEGICVCPLTELIKVNEVKGYMFETTIIKPDGTTYQKQVTKDSFPRNYDEYHYKMALLAEKYLKGEKNVLY